MTNAMQYDEEFTRKLVRIYSTPDVIGQRDKALSLVDLQPGERTLDIGTGPGLTTEAISQIVGETGSVSGIDISESAVTLARQRCADQPWVSIHSGDATNLQFDDGSFDVAVSTQVYEYVQELDTALAELYRVLRPGGRAVILDSDWDSCVWHTHNRERMHRIIEAWNTHCPRPFLPRTLKHELERAGFDITKRDVYAMLNPDYDQNTYSYGVIDFIQTYVKSVDSISDAELQAWANELHELGAKGEYFFSLNRYIFVVRKPN